MTPHGKGVRWDSGLTHRASPRQLMSEVTPQQRRHASFRNGICPDSISGSALVLPAWVGSCPCEVRDLARCKNGALRLRFFPHSHSSPLSRLVENIRMFTSQRTICRSPFSSFTVWVLELNSSHQVWQHVFLNLPAPDYVPEIQSPTVQGQSQ